MKTIIWEPWALSETERQQFVSEHWDTDDQLVTDLDEAESVIQGYRALYKPELALDELRVLYKKVSIVAEYARNLDEAGHWQTSTAANEFAAELRQKFADLAESK
ncbi:hypothetical protein [Microbulbifer discodermiae]|uniref:hypothetical protein n=1 Tax=Microbulbifer sp. 2201CG32-9 TaxID=3232309 RepID=UPI00345B617E